MIDRRTALLGASFMVGGAVRAGAWFGRRLAEPSGAIPGTIDLPPRVGNRGVAMTDSAILPQRDNATNLVYDDVIARSYRAPGLAPVIVLVAYGRDQGGGLEVHRPENCYPPYGFALSGSHELQLPLHTARPIAATALTATREGAAEQLLFWTRIGNSFPTSLWGADLSIARSTLANQTPDGALVRFSVTMEDAAAAETLLIGFAADLVRAAPASLRHVLVGQDAPKTV